MFSFCCVSAYNTILFCIKKPTFETSNLTNLISLSIRKNLSYMHVKIVSTFE
jgi:hypothetical protein